MSKLGCTCGHVIRDQTDRLPYKGRILRDFDHGIALDTIERECEALIAAVVAGEREAWLRRHFGDIYPGDLPNGAVFSDFVMSLFQELMADVYECEACGRLWVQRPGTDNEFAPYTPDGGKVERVLRSPRDMRSSEPIAGE